MVTQANKTHNLELITKWNIIVFIYKEIIYTYCL